MSHVETVAPATSNWQDRFNQLQPALQREIAVSLRGSSLELYINPTEKCNFRCLYCYEDFAIGRMRPSVVSSVKRLIDRSIPSIKLLNLGWFGGEPLAAREVMLDISRHAHSACAAAGVRLAGSITTNAALLDLAFATELASLRQGNFQVSFDGDREKHDQVRRRKDGGGTFDTIWANVLAILRSDLDVSLLFRLHLRGDNEDSVVQMLERIQAQAGEDQRVSVALQPLDHLGGPGTEMLQILSFDDYLAMASRLSARFPALSRLHSRQAGQGESSVPGTEQGCGQVCYACKPNAFLLRADGRVGKCTVALNEDFNTVGRLLPSGEIALDHRKLGRWTDPIHSLEAEALACPLRLGASHFAASGKAVA